MAMSASPALAGTVPAISGPQLTAAGSLAVAKASTARSVHALRPRDDARYTQLKADADARYSRWLAAQGSTAGTTIDSSPSASIVKLNKRGFSANNEGNFITPPDTTGAIGPNYYIEFVNSEIVVYSRSTLATPSVSSLLEDSFTGSTQRWLYWSLDCAA
jgi:hypothetical protein